MSTTPLVRTYEDISMLVAPPSLVDQLIGPLATGYILEILLYGSYCTLFLNYCLSGEYGRLPGRFDRIALAVLFLLVTCTTIMTFDALWKLAVEQTRTIDDIIAGPTESCTLTLLGGLTGTVTQIALARRAGGFIDNRKMRWAFYTFLALVIIASLFGSLSATVTGFIWAIQEPEFVNSLNWSTSVAIWLWSSAVADCVVSGMLALSLRRRIAGFNARTDSLLQRLVWLSIRSASYTAVVAVGGAIAGSLYRDTVIEWSNLTVAFWAPMPPLYGFAFFSTTSSSRRAIEEAFRPPLDAATTRTGGEVLVTCRGPTPIGTGSPSSVARSEKRSGTSVGPLPSWSSLSRFAGVLDRVRATYGGTRAGGVVDRVPKGREEDLEEVGEGEGGGGGGGGRGRPSHCRFAPPPSQRSRGLSGPWSKGTVGTPCTTSEKKGDRRSSWTGRPTSSWRSDSQSLSHSQSQPIELRIQVDQLVETMVEWCENDAEDARSSDSPV